MELNREITEKIETQLRACKMCLYQLKNSDNLTEEQRTTRCQLIGFHLSEIEKLLSLDIEEFMNKSIKELETIKSDEEDGK